MSSYFGFSSLVTQVPATLVTSQNVVGTWAITQIGDPKRWYYVKSPTEYRKLLGSPISASAREAFNVVQNGIGVWIKPIVHLGDVDDFETIEGDVATVSINSGAIVVNAKTVGSGYNGLTIAISAAKSGDVAKKDIVISLNGFNETYSDIPTTLTEDAIAILNSSNWVDFALGTGTDLVNGTFTLSGGTKDTSLVVDEDFIGSAGLRTGIYGLNELTLSCIMLYLGGWAVTDNYLTEINSFLENTYRNFHFGIKGNFNAVKTRIGTVPSYKNVRFIVGEPYRTVNSQKISYDGSSSVVIRNAKKAFFYEAVSTPSNRLIDDGSQGLSQIFSTEEVEQLVELGAIVLVQDNGIKIASTGTAWKVKGDPFSFTVKTDLAIITQRFMKGLFEDRYKSQPNNPSLRKCYFDELSAQLTAEQTNGFLATFDFFGDQETPNSEAVTIEGDTWKPVLTLGVNSPLDKMEVTIVLTNS